VASFAQENTTVNVFIACKVKFSRKCSLIVFSVVPLDARMFHPQD